MPDPSPQLTIWDQPPKAPTQPKPKKVAGGSPEPVCDNCGDPDTFYDNENGHYCLAPACERKALKPRP